MRITQLKTITELGSIRAYLQAAHSYEDYSQIVLYLREKKQADVIVIYDLGLNASHEITLNSQTLEFNYDSQRGSYFILADQQMINNLPDFIQELDRHLTDDN